MMWPLLAVMKRNIWGKKKCSRVADESMDATHHHHHDEQAMVMHDVHMMRRPTSSSHGFSFICSMLRSPLALFSCTSSSYHHPHHHHAINGGAEGALWLSDEFGRVPEMMNNAIVSDNMRYMMILM
ncbi:hypothetical protein Scep_012580 [Stephania cephalantha]|uniref:Uncharacterized protein n=1 Tax=Stephania cephalantha TaxID=152367 RepID=A0AAP0JHK9_9MAGN